MFKLILKSPARISNRNSIILRVVRPNCRPYSKSLRSAALVKYLKDSYNCTFRIINCNYVVRSYSNQPIPQRPTVCPPKPIKKASHGTAYTIGAVTLVALGTIGYAKYDSKFRAWLGANVPFTDGFFKFIFEEEQTYGDSIKEVFGNFKSLVDFGDTKKKAGEVIKAKDPNYTPPRAVFPAIAQQEPPPEKYNEIRVQKKGEESATVSGQRENEKPSFDASPYNPKSIADLEIKISEAATVAIKGYNEAETALKRYNQDIQKIVDESVDKIDPNVWTNLKKKSKAKDDVLKESEINATQAVGDIKRFSKILEGTDIQATKDQKATARRNVSRLLNDIEAAKDHYVKERESSHITESYWGKVEQARCKFVEELEILFPDIDIAKKKLSLKQEDIDLFMVHVCANLLYYQKEMAKLATIAQNKLKAAIEAARSGDPNFSIVETAIQEGLEVEKRKLNDEFSRKCLEIRKISERELRHRLKCQEQAHIDHLADALAMREQELERQFTRTLDEQAATEQSKNKMQMAGMIARMKGMRNAINERVEADKQAHQSQVLWSACQALHRAVKTSIPGTPWKEQIKPLRTEVKAIQEAATGDELVSRVIAGIPEAALDRGVYPEGAIHERFLKVERVARSVALIPEEGARLPLYLLSFMQSSLLINAGNPIPQSELDNEKTDFSKLDTYDILQRARYWLDRGNYTQTLKYMNLLQGAAKCIASDWIRETRILLETQQAAETLMAHAIAGGLLHL